MTASSRPVALVTGAAHGIGRAVSVHLASNGWRVVALDLPHSKLSTTFAKYRRSITVVAGDVTQEHSSTRATRQSIELFGRLDAVVSNAGLMIRRPIGKLTLADWHRVLETNLTATFMLAQAAEAALRKAKGSIVAVASTRASMSEPDTEAYAASKGGLVALTHALAISLGPDVRVNCVSPGWIATENYTKLRRKDHEQHPVGRVGKPEDVAEIVAWLLDRKRSGFVTGANFVVDGGMTRKMIYEA